MVTHVPSGAGSRELIAIVGMAALMPGARDLDSYWRNLVDGVDAITEVSPHRWNGEFYDPQAHRPDRVYCRRGGFVDEYVTFEPLKYGIMPTSVPSTEPDQLISLELAAQAIEDAGGPDRLPDRKRVGVFLGRLGVLNPAQSRFNTRVRVNTQIVQVLRELLPELDEETLERVRQRFDERLGPHRPEGTIGLVPSLAAATIANRLDLGGPACLVDAACASSLLAVDQGVSELVNGRLDAVLVGGVHHVHDITFWSVFSQLRALSHRGQIRPFDTGADGTLLGEGTGVVVLKRYADAFRDGDRVYAVIRGIGVSSDGRSASLFNPAVSGQVLAIQRAWAAAGLDPTAPDALGMLEAHGTGTPVGDAAELTAVAQVFGRYRGGSKPVIGSVKSMIGHTMAAAGIASLIKAALAVHRGVLLPTLGCESPRTELAATRFAPIATARPWQSDGPRRAAVSAFGFGGINAHVIVEQVPEPAAGRRRSGTRTPTASAVIAEPDEVLWLAAADPAGLTGLLDRDDQAVRALGIELSRGTRSATHVDRCRLGVVNPTDKSLAFARRIAAAGQPWRGARDLWFSPDPLLAGGGRLAFVFPGLEAEFSPRTADIAAHFGLADREWSNADPARHGAGLVELGRLLDQALGRMRVTPEAMAGTSIGEWTAAVISGQIDTVTADEFLRVFDPGILAAPGYVFAAVGAGAERISLLLADFPGLVLSHDDAPTRSVVNGPEEQVDRLLAALRELSVPGQKLPVRTPSHTPAFATALSSIGAALGRVDVCPARVPLWSATLAAPSPTDEAAVRELFGRVLMEPVRFRQTVAAMYDAGFRVFLEVGVGQLASLIGDNLRGRDHLAIPVNVAHRDGLNQLRRVATALWVEGGTPDLRALDVASATTVPATTSGAGQRGPVVHLDLSGALVRLGDGAADLLPRPAPAPRPAGTAIRPAPEPGTVLHRNTLTISMVDMPYLRDHCFYPQPDDWPAVADRWPVVPGTTIVQHMIDAAGQAVPDMRVIAVRDARFGRWVAAEPPQDVEVTVKAAGDGRLAVTFGGYARATVEVAADYPVEGPPAWRHDPATERPAAFAARQMYAERLWFHGPRFQGVTEVHGLGDRHIRGELTTPASPGSLLDSSLHLIGNWMASTQPHRTGTLPVRLGHVRFYGPPPPVGRRFECVVRVREITASEVVVDIQLVAQGRVWAQLDGVTGGRFESPQFGPAGRFPERRAVAARAPEGWTMVFDSWPELLTRNMVARALLGSAAYDEYERQPVPTRRQWLLGRIAAKDAVRFPLWEYGATDIYPVELPVADDSDGRTRVRVRPGLGPRPDWEVSLAHCAELGVAIAAPRHATEDGRRVGIDVAEVTATDPGVPLSAAESALLAASNGDARPGWLARWRAVRGAVGRAEGAVADGTPPEVIVVSADTDTVTVAVADRTYRVGHRVVCNPDGLPSRRYVVAWTWGSEPTAPPR